MDNPFDVLLTEIQEIKHRLNEAPSPTAAPAIEIIDTKELCKRLDITEGTVIRYKKKGKIPFMTIGSAVRFNWPSVIASLEKKTRNE